MKLTTYSKHIPLTEAMEEYLEKKIAAVEHAVGAELTVRVTLERSMHHRHGEVFGIHILATVNAVDATIEESAGDFYTGVDLAMVRLRQQLNKSVEKRRSRTHRLG